RPASLLGHRDVRGELLERRLQDALCGAHRPGPPLRGVRRGHHRHVGPPGGQHAETHRRRLVHVDDVEVAVDEPAPDPRRHPRAEADPGHGAVVRNRDRPAHRGDVRRQVVVVIPGGDHRYRIAAAQEFFGEVPDVDLYATWNVPRVGTRDPDLHDDTGSARRASSGSRSARNSRWVMCPSAGWARIPTSKASAIRWVMIATRLPRSGGTSTGSWNVTTKPWSGSRPSYDSVTGTSGAP